jgi:hypothetical protein
MAGKQWHSYHFEKNIRKTIEAKVAAICQECGNVYLVSSARVSQGKYCGNNCRARALRKRRKDEKSG